LQSAGARVGDQKLGNASRAMMALNAGDPINAVKFAEQAAEKSPESVEVRLLLANAYFAAGRFASAETSYRDTLRLNDNQPKAILKLVLVQIAQGKNVEALTLLNAAKPVLETADYGLALALAGNSQDAIAALEPAARTTGADSRIRQNLAFSYAMSGNWSAARTIASQDVPADQLDSRIEEWMRLASPARPYDQVAALTGVTPSADPGQPVRLALRDPNAAVATAQAAAVAPVSPVPATPAAVALPVVPVAEAAPPPMPAFTPVEPLLVPVADDEPFVEVPAAQAAQATKVARPARAPLRAAAFVPRKPVRAVARPSGRSSAVLQLGAYGSPQRAAAAWSNVARRYSALRAYMPVGARFQSAKGTFYRLSVKGFQSPNEAKNLCIALRRSGGSCFVREVAGDAPVQLALR
jgi:Flp pilus assembly protein TadD